MSERKGQVFFTMGNEAIVEGAIAAGARFYAGYPITPSSEVAEISSYRLPQEGGVFVQMEDEIGSIAAIIGASAAGVKAYTATSGPGFSLMQENLGVAVNSEIPVVVIDVQRGGPSTGLATKPAQADVMQARWGTHGDHGIIALSPSSVQECYDLTIKAFNLAERYRTPVILLADAVVGHMREQYVRWEPREGDIVNRKVLDWDPDTYMGYDFSSYPDEIAPLAPFGSNCRVRITSSTHFENGDASDRFETSDALNRHFINKFEINRDDIVFTERFALDDADCAIVAFGCSVRPALAAMNMAREKGLKAGVLQLKTVWPFADKEVSEVLARCRKVIVPEMNLGQVIREVQRLNTYGTQVVGVNRADCRIMTPQEILDEIEEVAK